MARDYITEIKGFYDLVANKSLSAGQIALWHALMYINNKCYWEDNFSVPNLTLQLYTGLSRQGITKARNELKQKGLIDFVAGKRGQSTIYSIKRMSKSVQISSQVVDTSVAQQDTNSLHKSSTLKRQKTKDKDINITPIIPFEGRLLEKVNLWLAYKAERGQKYKPTGMEHLFKKIKDGVSEYGEDAVIQSIDNSISNNWQGLFFDNVQQKNTAKSSGNPFLDMLKEGAFD